MQNFSFSKETTAILLFFKISLILESKISTMTNY